MQGFLCARGNEFFEAATLAAGINNRPQLSQGGSGGSNVAGRQCWPGLGLPYRMAGGRHLLPTPTSSLSNKKDGCRKVRAAGHGGHRCCWRHPHTLPLVTTAKSAMRITISTGGRFPPPPGLGTASQCIAVPYGIINSVHCAARACNRRIRYAVCADGKLRQQRQVARAGSGQHLPHLDA